MAVTFDDLIPGGEPSTAAPPSVTFDDLIPKEGQSASPAMPAKSPKEDTKGWLEWIVSHIGGSGKQGAIFSEDKQGNVNPAGGLLTRPFAAGSELIQHGYTPRPLQPVSSEETMPDLQGIKLASEAAPAGMTGTNFPRTTREAIQGAVAADNAATAAFGPRIGPSGLEQGASGFKQWIDPATGQLNVKIAPSARDRLVQEATDIGVQLPDAATRGKFTQNVAGGIGVLPTGTPIQNRSAKAIEQLEGAAKGVADELGSGGVESAGEGARDNILQWIRKDLPEQNRQAYDALDKALGGRGNTVQVPLSNTQRVIRELEARDAISATDVGARAASFVQEAADRPGMSFKGIKELRTRLFDRMNEGLEPGVSEKATRLLYDALGDDMKFAVQRAGRGGYGKARALDLFTATNAAAREGFEQREKLLTIIGHEGKDNAEAITERLLRMANAKGGADIDRLTRAKSVMSPAAWNEVASALLARMGKSTNAEGGFSIAKWRTAYDSLSEAGKQALFGTSKDKLDKIFRVGDTVNQLAKWGNPSGSARVGITAGAISSGLAAPHTIPALATAAAGDYLLARFLARIAKPSKAGAPMLEAATATPARRAAASNAMKTPFMPGDTASNPDTGDRVKFDGRQWVPIQ